MADEKKYKIVGVFGLLPENYSESVWPVYREEGDGELYIDNGVLSPKGYIISEFEKLKPDYVEKVRMLGGYETVTDETDQEFYKVGDPVAYPFHLNEKSLYIGPPDKYLTFLVSYRESIKDCNDEDTLSQLDEEIKDLTELMNSIDKDKNIEPTP